MKNSAFLTYPVGTWLALVLVTFAPGLTNAQTPTPLPATLRSFVSFSAYDGNPAGPKAMSFQLSYGPPRRTEFLKLGE